MAWLSESPFRFSYFSLQKHIYTIPGGIVLYEKRKNNGERRVVKS